jgi:hypothetical protein
MTRAGREPAEDVKRRLIAACAELGQEVTTAIMRLIDGVRLIYVQTPTVGLIARVPASGEWPTMVDVRCSTSHNLYDPLLRFPRFVPFDELVPMLRKTLEEREKVIAAMRLGIEAPYRFEGSEWAKPDLP